MADRKTPRKTFTAKQKVQIVLTILAVLFLFVVGYFIGKPMVALVSDPGEFQVWVERQGILGVLAFIGMVIFQVFAAIIPGGPFQIGAGYAFGVWKGSLICDFATTLASVVIFLLVRRFGVSFIELFIDKEKLEYIKFLKDNEKVEGILFLLFLIPGTPKDLLSYFAGLTRIKLSHWIFICGVGRFPAIFLSCISGSALSTAQYELAIAAMVVIIVCSVGGILIYRHHTGKNPPTGMK